MSKAATHAPDIDVHFDERMLEVSHIIEAQELSPDKREVRVTIIKGGQSVNGFVYSAAVLKDMARLLEGAKAYADHARSYQDEVLRSVRDVVGFYHDVKFVGGGAGRVDGVLHIFESADWLWQIIRESVTLGVPDLIGLSVDFLGTWLEEQASDYSMLDSSTQKAKKITQVVSINSCDIVTKPSAGGEFLRLLEASRGGLHVDKKDKKESETNDDAGGGGAATAVASPPATPVTPTINRGATPPTVPATPAPELSGRVSEADVSKLLDDLRKERASLATERKLMESKLPTAAQKAIRDMVGGRVLEANFDGMLDAMITTQRALLAELAKDGAIVGMGEEKPGVVSGMVSEAEKVQAAFDLMFGVEIDNTKFAGIKPLSSIREAYVRATGDTAISGVNLRDLGLIRVGESAPIPRITEADTTTASFSFLLGTSMNKRLLKDYQAWPAEWVRFCTIVPIKDFKQQTRIRLGAFTSMPIVPEDTLYGTLTLQDSAASYVPQKRGTLVNVSRETIINDDLFAIKQIPTKLATAAAYTLAEFVYGFLSSNATIYDGSALFTNGAPHSNLGSSALSSAAMQTGVTAMREQTNFAGKRIGLKPSFLIVPAELEWIAMVATKSAGVPGSANNDINPMLGYVTPIVSPQLSNTTQWFMAADPTVVDTIEIGFVGGQVNPALFIQDSPLYGTNFTSDVIAYKLRHEYGGAVTDYRGLYRGI